MKASKRMRTLLPGLACAMLLPSAPAGAHHSTSEYDLKKLITLSGVVEATQWSNPHCYLTFVVKDPRGTTSKWRIEYGTPGVNLRLGLRKDSIKPGDKVKMVLSPAVNGSTSGALMTATFADGREIHTPIYFLTKRG